MADHDTYEDTVTNPHNRAMRRSSGRVDINSKAVAFFYLLMRDHLTPGIIADLMIKLSNPETGEIEPDNQYTNGWLAKMAQYFACEIHDNALVGPDDPAGCPGNNGSSCCGHHKSCEAALGRMGDGQ